VDKTYEIKGIRNRIDTSLKSEDQRKVLGDTGGIRSFANKQKRWYKIEKGEVKKVVIKVLCMNED